MICFILLFPVRIFRDSQCIAYTSDGQSSRLLGHIMIFVIKHRWAIFERDRYSYGRCNSIGTNGDTGNNGVLIKLPTRTVNECIKE